MGKIALPDPQTSPLERATAKAIEPEQLAVVQPAAEVMVASMRTARGLELDLADARQALARATFDAEVDPEIAKGLPALAAAVLAAQQAYEDAALDTRLAQRDCAHLADAIGAQYGVADPRNRVDLSTGSLRR